MQEFQPVIIEENANLYDKKHTYMKLLAIPVYQVSVARIETLELTITSFR